MSFKLKDITTAKLKSKTVIVRANLDVPITDGEVTDNTKLKAMVPTLELLLQNKCKIIIIGHLGRPNGEHVDSLSLMPVRFELGKILEKSIKFANMGACINSIKFMEAGEILMLENLRFHAEEESEDSELRLEFMKPLIEMGDIYINDCFGVYRKHASVYEIAQNMESYAGISMLNEVESMDKLIEQAEKPYVAIVGGAKLETKVPIIHSLVQKVDRLIIGGAMAYVFLKSMGHEIGKSKYDESSLKLAKEIIKLAKENKVELLLPVDHIVTSEFDKDSQFNIIENVEIPKDKMALDIGPKTIELFTSKLSDAHTILWNGPMGVFEWENFQEGTRAIAEFITLHTSKETFKVAGGGDTVSAIELLKIKKKRFDHISIGGGMMLEYLSGAKFDVLEILRA